MKKIYLTIIMGSLLFASNEYNSNISEDNYNKIINEKKEIERRKLQEEYLKQLKIKQKNIEEEREQNRKILEEIKKEKEELVLLKNRIKELKKEIEGKVSTKIISSFSQNKASKNAEIISEMLKNDKESTIRLLILQNEETILEIMKKMEAVDSAKLLQELINYKTKIK